MKALGRFESVAGVNLSGSFSVMLLPWLIDAVLKPGFYFTLHPAGATTQFNWLRKIPVFNQLVEPFIGQAREAGDECHIDHFVVKQAGIVVLSGHDDCFHMHVEIYGEAPVLVMVNHWRILLLNIQMAVIK